jgi:hypothetical protein
MEPIDFAMEEYRALRTEIIQSMNDGNQIMGFGLAAIGVVQGAVLTFRDTAFAFYALVLWLPALTSIVMSYWFAAQERIAKASHYLSGTEQRVKRHLGTPDAVSWEAWLRMQKTRHGVASRSSWTAELSGMCLFWLIMFSSFIVGLTSAGADIRLLVRIAVIIASVAFNLWLIAHVLRRYANWSNWLHRQYDPQAWADFVNSNGHQQR